MKCRVCSRELKNPKYVALGIGPVCEAKQAAIDAQRKAEEEDQPILTDAGKFLEVGLVCKRLEDGRLATNIPQLIKYHSPTGFECGYGGSGPADLALNVLSLVAGEDLAKILHQDFKWKFIASMPREGGRIPIETIRGFVAGEAHKEHAA